METGKTENKYSVKINNFQINLSKRVSKFENYDTIEENKKLRLFSNFYLPIEINKTTYKEYKNENINYSLEEAKQMAEKEATKKLDEQIQDKESILNKQVEEEIAEEYVEVEVIYEVLESIGTKEKIVF